MQKDREKQALECLKQIYLKNRERKTELANNRFRGFLSERGWGHGKSDPNFIRLNRMKNFKTKK